MKQKQTYDTSIEAIDESHPMVGYKDGDIVIIDNVRDLTDLRPLRPDYNFILLCCRGRLQVDINGKSLCMVENEVLFSSPGVILDHFMFSPDFECKVLCLSERIILSLLREETDIWNRAVYLRRMNVVRLPDDEVQQFSRYYALVHQKIAMGKRRFFKETMQTLTTALLLDLCTVLADKLEQPAAEKPSHARQLFDRFLAMVAAEEVKRRPVGYFAGQLAVTPKYLTMVCEQHSQKSASDWINQYVTEDVHYALRNTSAPMKEIADRLGFANISHFGTYVRRHLGMSPSVYRIESRKGEKA